MRASALLRSSLAATTLAAAVLGGCRGLADDRAEALVRRYNQKLIEAYRLGDERVIEGLVGDAEAKKILGLVGVKTDMGITLDAELREFRVVATERPARDRVAVLTEERWHYRDRQIGSGSTVGEESDDHYFLRYTLQREGKNWVVAEVSFVRPPEVGRTRVPNQAPAKVFHGGTLPTPRPASTTPGKGPR